MGEHQLVVSLQPHHEELLILADLAGVKVPTNIMKIMLELLKMNVPPTDIYQLLRDILVSRARSKRSSKQASQRLSAARQAESGTSRSTPSPAKAAAPQ